MSRVFTSDINRSTRAPEDELYELRDDELDQASGGLVVIAIIAVLIGLLY
jgi:hypothetical protein